MSIAVVSIPVSDQSAAKAFYTDMMAFEVVEDQPMGPQMRWLQLRPVTGGATVALVTWFDAMQPGGLHGLMIHVPDIDAEHARLTAKGVKLSPIDAQPWGRFTTLDDPDGNGLIVAQLTDPASVATR